MNPNALLKPLGLAGSVAILVTAACWSTSSMAEGSLAGTASEVARKGMMVDTHIDVPYRLEEEWADVTGHTDGGRV